MEEPAPDLDAFYFQMDIQRDNADWLAAHDQALRKQIADEISQRVPLALPGALRKLDPWASGWNQARKEALEAAIGGEQA